MPLGNYTSQFFANIYLHELDYFTKNTLKSKYYIRYVDDFVILHKSAKQLERWKKEIDKFLTHKLRLKLHAQKSRIIPISRGIDFIGFRNFSNYMLLRKRNVRNMRKKVKFFKNGSISFNCLHEIYQGWQAYALWADTHSLRNKIKMEVIDIIWDKINFE